MECRRQVTPYRGDEDGLARVCGNKHGLCGRSHVGAVRFGEGVYKTIAGCNKFVDGIGGTCITNEEYQAILGHKAAERGKSIAEAGLILGEGLGMNDLKPSSSEESGYQAAQTSTYVKGKFKSPPPKVATAKEGTHPIEYATTAGGKKNLGLGMTKVAQSGVREAVGGAVKKETGVAVAKAAAGSPDPMMETMQLMAQALGKLTHQMHDMSGVIKDLQKEDKTREVQHAVTPPIPPDLPPSGLTGPFYAVARGLKGHQGIYGTWSECASWVQGVPGNVFQKCHTLETAFRNATPWKRPTNSSNSTMLDRWTARRKPRETFFETAQETMESLNQRILLGLTHKVNRLSDLSWTKEVVGSRSHNLLSSSLAPTHP
jgi:hypothetical protein